MPTTLTARMSWSEKRFRRSAATRASTSPITTATTIAKIASSAVAGNA